MEGCHFLLLQTPSILQCLHDILSLKGYMQNVYSQIVINPAHSWILSYPISSLPVGSKGVQSSVLAVLSGCEMCDGDLVIAVKDKLKVSLGVDSLMLFVSRRIGFPKSFRLSLALTLT